MDWGRPIENASASNFTSSRSQPYYQASEQLAYVLGVGTATTLIFTVPAQTIYHIACIEIFNRDNTDRPITLRVVPAGADPDDASQDFFEEVIYARRLEVLYYPQIYPAGYKLVAVAEVADMLNVRVHGMNLVQQ